MNKQPLVSMTFIFIIAIILSSCSTVADSSIPYASIPAGLGYAEGQEIYFSHTETSDPDVADKLTNMMKSPVLFVPALAKVPDSSLALVYVFTNGVAGKGPLGFQPDVFNFPVGTDGYSPLRRIIFVSWSEGASALELKSESEILAALDSNEVNLEVSSVIVNMPFMTWDGGKR